MSQNGGSASFDPMEDATGLRTLIIDNYDSFTYNLFQYLHEINGVVPVVVYNNTPWQKVEKLLPQVDNIVISPGPGHPERPEDFGICRRVLLDDSVKIPVLGVCLGLQGLVTTFGGVVTHAPEPMHGRISQIIHDESYLFQSIPQVHWASIIVSAYFDQFSE